MYGLNLEKYCYISAMHLKKQLVKLPSSDFMDHCDWQFDVEHYELRNLMIEGFNRLYNMRDEPEVNGPVDDIYVIQNNLILEFTNIENYQNNLRSLYKNSFVDLERPTDKAVKFKFISLEAPEAIEFGKDVENSDKGMGVIEVRWYLEKEAPYERDIVIERHHHHHYGNYPKIGGPLNPFSYTNGIRGIQIDNQLNADRVQSFYSPFTTPCDFTAPSNSSLNTASLNCSQVPSPVSYDPMQAKDGCTVEGGYSSQKFTSIHMDIEDCYTIIKLVLKGVKTVSKDRVLRDFEYTSEDKRILLEREELIQLELKLIAAKKAKLTAELAELTNS
jgi:hypothetical protein